MDDIQLEELQKDLTDLKHLCENLWVHKRKALNVLEQLHIMSTVDLAFNFPKQLKEILGTFLLDLKAALPLPRSEHAAPGLIKLDWYLAEGSISNVIEKAHHGVRAIIQSPLDESTRELINCQEGKYTFELGVDQLDLNQMLRTCLRDDSVFTGLSLKTSSKIRAFIDAVQLAESGSPLPVSELYKDWLIKWKKSESKKSLVAIKSIQDLTGEVTIWDSGHVSIAGVTETRKGRAVNTFVAIYLPRNAAQSHGGVLKHALEWAQYDHPNVLPLIGSCRDLLKKGDIALLSPWMDNGTIMSYLEKNQAADRLQLITDVVAGLEYLHTRSPPVAHANLTKANVFVDNTGAGIVGGLDWRTFWNADPNASEDDRLVVRTYSSLTKRTKFDPVQDVEVALRADIDALGVLIYEISAGDFPPEGYLNLNKGELPERPQALGKHHGLGEDIWMLLQDCWAFGGHIRSTAAKLLDTLRLLQSLPPLDVRDLTNEIDIDSDPHTLNLRGGFGEVRKGRFLTTGMAVAVKSLGGSASIRDRAVRQTKRFRREVTIWNQLHYQNVLPFLGIAEIKGLSTVLISPWMDGGDCITFLKAHPKRPRLPIVLGIVNGLKNVHGHEPEPVIHADLKGANILISSHGEPLLADFGLAVIVKDLTKLPISTALRNAGTTRWMAPELLMGEDIVSKESDIWALGMVVLELMTLDVPFREIPIENDRAFLAALLHDKKRPERPSGTDASDELSDGLWRLCHKCWSEVPAERPTAVAILREVKDIVGALN